MKVLSLDEPYATLVRLGLKRIETRSWRPPENLIGEQLAIASTKRKPRRIWRDPDQGGPDLYDHVAMGRYVDIWEDIHVPGQFAYDWCGPLGAIVATCTLVDVVPIIDGGMCEWHSEHPRGVAACAHAAIDGQVIVHTPDAPMHTTVTSDQLPYGDYAPGRFAWLLADIVPLDSPVLFKGGQRLTRTWEPA